MQELGRGLALGSKINLPMPPYSGDQSFMYVFNELVPTLLRQFQPEFIILVAGVDAHGGDPLSDMNYSTASYQHVIWNLRELAAELCHDRLIVLGAGGYHPANCALRWTEIAAALADYPLPEFVPAQWRTNYHDHLKEEAPVTFQEDATSDNTFERVERLVSWIKTKVFW
jgi:acetoin utilization protein AcuC